MSVNCLRIGTLRLALALMLALIVVPGYVVAPVLFAKAGSTALAGMLAGEVFHIANRGVIFLAAAVAFFWLRMSDSCTRQRWLLLGGVAAAMIVNEFVLSPIMIDLKLQMGSVDLVSEDNPIRQRFGMWHGVSAILHLIAALAAALLVALGPTARREANVAHD